MVFIIIRNKSDRDAVIKAVMQAPENTRVEFKETKRSLPQNAKLWASLSDVASQLKWHGQILSKEDWKLIFMDALKSEIRITPNINNNGFVNLGRSTSKLSVSEMNEMLELIAAFGANHNVKFNDPELEYYEEIMK